MAAKLNTTELGEFEALDSLESQAAYMMIKWSKKENVFNSTATTAVERITVDPDYNNNLLNFTANLSLIPQAIDQLLYDSVITYLP
jgi:hypothetical protein